MSEHTQTIYENFIKDLSIQEKLELMALLIQATRLDFEGESQPSTKGNIDQLMEMAGSLPDEEAINIRRDLDDEFSSIEGEW